MLQHGCLQVIGSPRRALCIKHKPSHEQCSSVPGLHQKDVTWDLWQKWLHPLCRGSLNQEGQQSAGRSCCPLKGNKRRVLAA